jgi:hypothetical protein
MDSNPYASPAAPVADPPRSPDGHLSWPQALAVWWSFIWRSAIYSLVGGFVLGAVAGGIAGATGHLDKAREAGMVGGYIATFLGSILAIKQGVAKHLVRLTVDSRV